MKEIERKFLTLDNSYRRMAVASEEICQGYLSDNPDATVRVRIKGSKGFITVKGRNNGIVRNEWEYEVPAEDAREMLQLCPRVLSKTRYVVPATDGLAWEIDEFHGRLEGLVVAEIELPSEDTTFSLPEFIGREVTGDPAYYNSNLSAQA